MPMSKPYTIGLIQMRCSRDPKESLTHAVNMLKQAAKQGVQVACLPELFLTEYFCQTEDHSVFARAESIPGPTTDVLNKLAKELNMSIIGSLFERRAAGIYHNTATIHDADGTLKGMYRKMHIPDDPLFYEKFYFTPGDLGFKAFDVKGARIGVQVCWDQWYPEGARLTALQGADVLLYPTAIGWHPDEKAEWGETQVDQWVTVQRGHAIANRCYVAAVNRIGHEITSGKGIEFFGNSFIADPYGRIIAQGSREKEEIVIATIDPAKVDTARTHWPHFRDRRIDAYDGLKERFGV